MSNIIMSDYFKIDIQTFKVSLMKNNIITIKDILNYDDINCEYNINTRKWSGKGSKIYREILKQVLNNFIEKYNINCRT